MIVYEEMAREPFVESCRLNVLNAFEPCHKLHCYSSVRALEEVLEDTVQRLCAFKSSGMDCPSGLTNIILIYSDPRAIDVVARRMEPGFEFEAWPQPDAWIAMYQAIDKLVAQARKYDPSFVLKHAAPKVN